VIIAPKSKILEFFPDGRPKRAFWRVYPYIGVNWPWITIKQVLGAEQVVGVRPKNSARLNGEFRRKAPSPTKKRGPRKGPFPKYGSLQGAGAVS
jgi:hypothetical protein